VLGHRICEQLAQGRRVERVQLDLHQRAVPLDEASGAAVGGLPGVDRQPVLPYLGGGQRQSAIYPYVAFLNSFDGSSACKTLNTNVRVVCANTFGAADAQGRATGREFTFRHTAGVHDRIEDAKRAVRGFRADTEEFRELATHLAGLRVSADQRELFVVEFIPAPHETVISPRVMGNIERDRSWLRGLLAEGSPTTDGIRDTAWGLVQAAGEFADHLRGFRNRETLLGRQLLRPEPLKAKAVRLAEAVAKV